MAKKKKSCKKFYLDLKNTSDASRHRRVLSKDCDKFGTTHIPGGKNHANEEFARENFLAFSILLSCIAGIHGEFKGTL